MKKQLLLTITLCATLTSYITFCSETPQPSYWKRFTEWVSGGALKTKEGVINTANIPLE